MNKTQKENLVIIAGILFVVYGAILLCNDQPKQSFTPEKDPEVNITIKNSTFKNIDSTSSAIEVNFYGSRRLIKGEIVK